LGAAENSCGTYSSSRVTKTVQLDIVYGMYGHIVGINYIGGVGREGEGEGWGEKRQCKVRRDGSDEWGRKGSVIVE